MQKRTEWFLEVRSVKAAHAVGLVEVEAVGSEPYGTEDEFVPIPVVLSFPAVLGDQPKVGTLLRVTVEVER